MRPVREILKPYEALHRIPLLPRSRLYGTSPIYCVPDLCHRLLVPVLSCPSASPALQFGEVGVSGSTSETKGKGGSVCVASQQGRGNEEWDMRTDASLLCDNYSRVGLRVIPVADGERWFLHQTGPLKRGYSSCFYLFICCFHFTSVFFYNEGHTVFLSRLLLFEKHYKCHIS